LADRNVRAGLLAGAGATLLTALAIAGALALLVMRTGEQKRFMNARGALCENGKTDACDALRSACDKRSNEACDALADAYLAKGPRHDAAEALRLFEEACGHHDLEACSRGGHLAATGTEIPKDAARAKKLLSHACELGQKDDCTAAAALP
jgi:TPR repeat protein